MPPTGEPSRQPPRGRSPFVKGLEARVRLYVERQGALRSGERALIAVSGGQDSLALLRIMDALAHRLGVEIAAVAHFDHRLRSREEALADEDAVAEQARSFGLPLALGRGDVRRRARTRGESIEEAARNLRLGFLGREARRLKAGVVVLGHTRDDRAETVLLHLLRGSGVDGLVGLRSRSAWPLGGGPALVRPLLEVSRAETARYCRERGLRPREDPTNLLLEATRNRVRHELLPALRAFNPRIEEALCRLGDAAAATCDFLEAAAEAAWREQASVEAGAVTFAVRPFASLAPALRARLLRRAVRHIGGAAADLEAVHLSALEELLTKGHGRAALPFRLTLAVDERRLRVTTGRRQVSRRLPETPLVVPGRTALPGWSVVAEIVSPPPAQPRPRGRLEAWLDADAVGAPVVRSRRAGDRLRPLGLGGEKKVQDVLVDAKVPAGERDLVPLVCADWGVAWVVGQRLDERAALGEGSRRALRLRFRRAAGDA